MIVKLSAQQVRRRCDPATLPFETTDVLAPSDAILGQDRAVRALDFGLRIAAPGYNIFAVGPIGTGRSAAISRQVAQVAAERPQAADWVYAHNFADARAPLALRLRPGAAVRLHDALTELVRDVNDKLPAAFDTDEYAHACDVIRHELQQFSESLYGPIAEFAQSFGMQIVRTATGLDIAPIDSGAQGAQAQIDEATVRAVLTCREKLEDAQRRSRRSDKDAQARLATFDADVARSIITVQVDDVRALAAVLCTDADRPTLAAWLDALQADMVTNRGAFLPHDPRPNPTELALFLNRYRVNVFVDHSRSAPGAPVVFEENGTHAALIGQIDRTLVLANNPAVATGTVDHMMLRPGALHRANGGFLIIDARTLLDAGNSLTTLLRSLQRNSVRIVDAADGQIVNVPTLAPQPIPLAVKVVLHGSGSAYWECGAGEEGFAAQFKVKAEFVIQMDRTSQNELAYAAFVRSLGASEGLAPFDRDAVAWLVEYGARLVDDQEKLSTRFGALADIAREASYWARSDSRNVITRADLRTAHAERRARVARYEDDTREFILRGVYHVSTSGEEVGQVNGLSVISLGDYEFGKPARITARSYVMRGGINDVDRSVSYTDPSHNKGIALVDSYLSGIYSTEQATAVSANVTFEQSLTHHEGDSASCAIMIALLSAVSGLPIPQSLALSGTLDQFGYVRPVGAVNTKLEGWYDLCEARGFDNLHGVILPKSNAIDLMLREDIVDAIEQGRFHVFTAEHVDDLIEMFFGMPAGQRMEDGHFSDGTLHALVEATLRDMADKLDGRRRGAQGEAVTTLPEPEPTQSAPPPHPIDPNLAPPPVMPEPEPQDPAMG